MAGDFALQAASATSIAHEVRWITSSAKADNQESMQNAREMRADWGKTGPKLYADWRALYPCGGSKTAFLKQHEGVVGTP